MLDGAPLVLEVEAAEGTAAPWMAGSAKALFDRALEDDWAADGADGFVHPPEEG
jgi:sulfoquinovose isomerase